MDRPQHKPPSPIAAALSEGSKPQAAAAALAWLMDEGLYEPLDSHPADWATFKRLDQRLAPASSSPTRPAKGTSAQGAPAQGAPDRAPLAKPESSHATSPQANAASGASSIASSSASSSAPPIVRAQGRFAASGGGAGLSAEETAALQGALSAAKQSASQAQDLASLEQAVRDFEGCALKKLAKSTVFADGQPGSPVMFLGEAPGADEDRNGKPFVGVSGQLLDRMLSFIDLDRRQNFYISNILFWRPPGNRTPTSGEIALCDPFVRRHIALAKPKILVFLGGSPAKALTGCQDGILKQRGKWLEYYDPSHELRLPALPMLHPAYLLRQSRAKREAWADCLTLKSALSGEQPIGKTSA